MKFVGGPLDGLEFSADQTNAVGRGFLFHTESGVGSYLSMPSPAEITKILRGEMQKDEAATLHGYELVFSANGEPEWHDSATVGGYAKALEDENRPPSPATVERRRDFASSAVKLLSQVKDVEFGPTTEVFVVYFCEDQSGNLVEPIKISATPTTRVRYPGNKEAAEAAAAKWHRKGILDSIRVLVETVSTGFTHFPSHLPGVLVRIVGFGLEINA
jgi:hypothetical protein